MFRSFKTIIRDFLIYFLVELLLFEEINEEIPDNGLKGSKHVGLFIKSVLGDFSVT